MYSQVSIGLNVKNATENLKTMQVKEVFDAIRNPQPDVLNKIRQIRIIKQINPTKYMEVKRQLPYFVCASFSPQCRKNENFAYTECFVLDIDHISEKGFVISDIKTKIIADPRTLLCFNSVGNDGLKVVMHLKERCYDAGLFSIFYKCFLLRFSEMYNLQQVVDPRTSNVTRACFFSSDFEAYFNPDSDAVDLKAYVDENDSLGFFDTKKNIEEISKETEKLNKISENSYIDPDRETMDRIKMMLNPDMKKKRNKQFVFVPEILNDIIGGLKENIEKTGVEVVEIENIQYGKKIKMKLGLKLAEINLFYGKRGFSVVQTPKTGTNQELNQLMADLVECYVAQL